MLVIRRQYDSIFFEYNLFSCSKEWMLTHVLAKFWKIFTYCCHNCYCLCSCFSFNISITPTRWLLKSLHLYPLYLLPFLYFPSIYHFMYCVFGNLLIYVSQIKNFFFWDIHFVLQLLFWGGFFSVPSRQVLIFINYEFLMK